MTASAELSIIHGIAWLVFLFLVWKTRHVCPNCGQWRHKNWKLPNRIVKYCPAWKLDKK